MKLYLFLVLLGAVVAGLVPLAAILAWHLLALLASVAMFYLLVEEHGDLDSGFVALAILMLGAAGVLLGWLSAIGWPAILALAFPSISMTAFLLMKRNGA